MPRLKLTKAICEKPSLASEGGRTTYWDTEIHGLGLRVSERRRTWVFKYQYQDKQRWASWGRYGDPLTLPQAREKAAQWKLQLGVNNDPAVDRSSKKLTLGEMWDLFMEQHAPKRAPATIRMYRAMGKHFILPHLGADTPLEDIGWKQVHALHARMRDVPVQANRMLNVVSKVFEIARKLEHYDRFNPGRGHDRYPEKRSRGRCLPGEELSRLGEQLFALPESDLPRAGILLTALTGLRPDEIRKARWEELRDDGRVLRLGESKTGPKIGYLGRPAAEILAGLPRLGSWILPGQVTGKPFYDNFRSRWEQVREAADLAAGTRLYDLRHTFTTVAQEQLAIPRWRVALIIGHAPNTGDMTGKYTHAADPGLLEDADRISEWLWTALGGEASAGGEVEISD